MPRAGLITFHASYNFGSVMQAWALQNTVREMGFDCDIINFRPKAQKDKYSLFPLRYGLRTAARNIIQLKYIGQKYRANKKYEDFICHTLGTTEEFNSLEELNNKQWNYDVYIAGSDQIWAYAVPEFIASKEDERSAYYLAFADGYKISYGSSTGASSYEELSRYKPFLERFSCISVREERGREILEKITGRSVSVVLDPTYLIAREQWQALANLAPKAPILGKYVLIYSLQGLKKAKRWRALSDLLYKNLGLNVVTVSPFSPIAGEHIINRADAGPLEILSLFEGAQCVATDTFHGTSFAVHFRKRFALLEDGAVDYRKKNILDKFNLASRAANDVQNCLRLLADEKINYGDIEDALAQAASASRKYLEEALNGMRETVRTKMAHKKFEITPYENCTGCAACANVCSTGAITASENDEGFLYPVIDFEKCALCGLCIKVCPANGETKKHRASFYMGWHRDADVVKKSSSGGAFTALCEYAFGRNGVVFGAAKDAFTWEVRHVKAENMDGIEEMRLSKYYQSDAGTVYKQIKELLANGVFVLFSGTACQVAGLYSFLGGDDENLLTVDVLCHGCASGKAVRCYIKEQEKKYKKSIANFHFRTKDVPWVGGGGTQVKLEFADGSVKIEDRRLDAFFVAFNGNLCLRESCYRCKYCGRGRVSDFTIADYWGVTSEFVPRDRLRDGVSLVLANTEKAKRVLTETERSFYFERIEPNIAIANNLALTRPNDRPKERNLFYKDMAHLGFDKSAHLHMRKYFFLVYLRKTLIAVFGEKLFELARKYTRRRAVA